MGGDYEEDWELLEKKLEDKTAEKAQNGSARDHDAAADGRGSRGEKRDRDRRDGDDSRDRGRIEETDAGLTAGIDAETATGAGGAGPRADQGPDPEIAATGGR